MQYFLEVENSKEKFLLDVLKYFPFVRIFPLTKNNIQFIADLHQSIEQVRLAKKGKIKLQKARNLINEL
jgi:hypothetical protein